MKRWGLVWVLLLIPAVECADAEQRQGRQRAPESFACDRNNLTVYTASSATIAAGPARPPFASAPTRTPPNRSR